MALNPFFTIGIPVYNAEKYLKLCIDSILNQTFEDFELILVNDGSKDSSLEICQAYARKDSRVIVIDQQNGGISSASNRILENARGRYVYLMDNDDEMYEGILEKANRYLTEDPVDILIGGYYSCVPNEGMKLRLPGRWNIKEGFIDENEFYKYYIEVGFPTSMWTKFIRSEFWRESDIRFNSEFDGYQDADVSERLMKQAKTVRCVDDIIVIWYHPREGSVSTEWSYNFLRNNMKLTVHRITEILQSDISEDLKREVIKKDIYYPGQAMWMLPKYSRNELTELDRIIYPIRDFFHPEFADDKRTRILYWCIRNFGVRYSAKIIVVMRKIKCMTTSLCHR